MKLLEESPMARHPLTVSRSGLVAFVLACLFGAVLSAQTASGPDKKNASCALLAKSDIQSIIGKPVKEVPAAPAAVDPFPTCEYTVGDDGLFSVRVKAAGPAETPEAYLAGLADSRIKTEPALGFGDRSFFAYPGSGMLQLYAYRGGQWTVMTLLIPGRAEISLKAPLERLMRKAMGIIR
jgi:hypothetical protein